MSELSTLNRDRPEPPEYVRLPKALLTAAESVLPGPHGGGVQGPLSAPWPQGGPVLARAGARAPGGLRTAGKPLGGLPDLPPAGPQASGASRKGSGSGSA